jgi:hypothetical protein
MNKNPTMKGASKNLSLILNPKPKKEPRHKEIEREVLKRIFEE